MDSWATFPDLLEQFPTDQQPDAFPFGYPLPVQFDPGNESALNEFVSAQQTTNLLEPFHPLDMSPDPLLPVSQDTWTASVTDATIAELTTAPMGPPPKHRRKKAPTLRNRDWEPYKNRILELHDTQKLSLQKVKEMIEEEFGFTAELRQYQARISKWGKDKNIKKQEMAAIVRKRQQRKLVEIDKREQSFSVRGRDVDPNKIDRWMVRNNVSQTSLHAPSPVTSTPSAIFCRTISERGSVAPSPAYSTRSLDFSPRSAISINSSPTPSLPVTFIPGMDWQDPRRLPKWHIFKWRRVNLGREHPSTVQIMIEVSCGYVKDGNLGGTENLCAQALSKRASGESHPDALFAADISISTYSEQGRPSEAEKFGKQMLTMTTAVPGKGHIGTHRSMLGLAFVCRKQEFLNDAGELLRQDLQISLRLHGESHPVVIIDGPTLTAAYPIQGPLEEAEDLGEQILNAAHSVLDEQHPEMLECIAFLISTSGSQLVFTKASSMAC